MHVGDGLGEDFSIQRTVTAVQQSVLDLLLHVFGWHGMGSLAGSPGQVGFPAAMHLSVFQKY